MAFGKRLLEIKFYFRLEETFMAGSFKWLAAITVALGLFAAGSFVGCDSKSDTATNATGGSTTQPSVAGSTTQPSSGGEAVVSNKALKLAFVTNNASDYWTTAKAGVMKGAEEAGGVTAEFKIPSEQTAGEQQRIVDDLLATEVDGIAISPSDPQNQTSMLNKAASKALLITQDSDAPDSNRVCYLGSNNHDAGKQAGELIKRALPDGGDIMIFVGTTGAQNAIDRLAGIHEVIDGTKIHVLDVRTDDAQPDKAKTNAQDTLSRYPNINALVGLYSYNGLILANAVREAGKKGTVKIVCFDFDPGVLEAVKDGTVFGTVVQQPYEFGRQAVLLMAKYLRGDHSVIPSTKQIIVPTLGIDAAGVDDFMAKVKAAGGK
jgi:ribose transport system substrate-binding protein